ncbi:hypothetical protein SESBI_34883 [Sesbania bispinosa]|nr:hypothetical protein SESBI_34883 [Sesbania bispinosa]
MASSNVLCRLSSRLQTLSRNKFTKPSFSLDLKSTLTPSQSASARRVSLTSRLPVELGSWESMMPLHSAVASARLVSSLSIESLGWGLVPQGYGQDLTIVSKDRRGTVVGGLWVRIRELGGGMASQEVVVLSCGSKSKRWGGIRYFHAFMTVFVCS